MSDKSYIFSDEKPDKTEETKIFYLARAKKFRERCARDLNVSLDEVDSLVMASHLSDMASEYSRATVRLYKAMLYYYFEVNSDDYIEDAVSILADIDVSLSPKKTLRTSGLRAKSMSENTFASIVYALSLPDYKGKYTYPTAMWLKAGALTGLRPHEWQHAELVENNGFLMLKVKNGKNTNNRAHGDYRHLNLSDLPDFEKQIIEDFLTIISPYKQSDSDFKKFYFACVQTLRKLNKRFEKGHFFTPEQGFKKRKGGGVYFPSNEGRRVQLYTGRHVFSSLMKKVASITEVAAMMGHKTDKTATLHYGKAVVKTAKTRRPKPVSEELKKVEQKYKGAKQPAQQTPVQKPIQQTPTPVQSSSTKMKM